MLSYEFYCIFITHVHSSLSLFFHPMLLQLPELLKHQTHTGLPDGRYFTGLAAILLLI